MPKYGRYVRMFFRRLLVIVLILAALIASYRFLADVKDRRELMHSAIIEGYVNLVEFLLILEPKELNKKNRKGRTLLTSAVEAKIPKKERYDMVNTLLDWGADVNIPDNYGETPLMRVVRRDKNVCLDTATLLIEKGADINARNNAGETVLMKSAESGTPTTFHLLVERGADLHAKDLKGNTVLMKAWRSPDITRFLIDNGVNADIKNRNGETAFGIALKKGYFTTAKSLPTLKTFHGVGPTPGPGRRWSWCTEAPFRRTPFEDKSPPCLRATGSWRPICWALGGPRGRRKVHPSNGRLTHCALCWTTWRWGRSD